MTPRPRPGVIRRKSRWSCCRTSWGRAGSTGDTGKVTPLQRYIAEEIATDHVDGLLSRREALRRLGLLGIGATAASTLIAACGEKRPAQPQASAPVSTTAPTTAAGGSPPGNGHCGAHRADRLGRSSEESYRGRGRQRKTRVARCW